MALFQQLGWIFAATMGALLLTRALRLPSLLGYLLVGFCLGPLGLGVIQAGEWLQALAQIGMSALLFIVGANVSPREFKEIGKRGIFVGVGQIFLAFACGAGGAYWFGFSLPTMIVIGLAFAFNSTILALKSLTDRGDSAKLHGKMTASVLLVQDVFATLVLVTIGWATGKGSVSNLVAVFLLKLALIFCGVWMFARWILPWMSRQFSRSQEMLLIFAFALPMSFAALFHSIGLSAEMGALAGGLCLSASPYRFDILAKMKSIREIFLVLFFVLLGTTASFSMIQGHGWFLLWGLLFFSLLNPLIVSFLMHRAGYASKTAWLTGWHLSHVSEFALILCVAAAPVLHLDPALVSLMTLLAFGSLLVGSLIMLQADRFAEWGERLFGRRSLAVRSEKAPEYEVLLFGCHRVGSDFLPILKQKRLAYLVVDFDPEAVLDLEANGIPCRYGDAGNGDFLEEIGLKKVKTLISTIPDVSTNLGLLHRLKKQRSGAVRLFVASSVEDALRLYAAGATYVILPHFLGGNYASQLFAQFGSLSKGFTQERERHIAHLKQRGKFVATTPMLKRGRWRA